MSGLNQFAGEVIVVTRAASGIGAQVARTLASCGAGPVGVFAVMHGIRQPGEVIGLRQGHFIGRPGRLDVTLHGTRDDIARVKVAGPVAMVGRGTLEVLPQADG